ncbi:hypothetical protein BKA56DRAFT_615643 [Ilyonectria sp. MPI-CAGE-AT-0026]|nr:hypothetical protein BKA56DRAFT_615643 [Ilyonectria sp. MPI-CAGE-AT-0026]
MENSSTSGSSSSQSNSGGGGINTSNAVAVVALAISIVALMGTIMQVLQQYYASAAGYSNCHESVVGDWSKSKKRIFRPSELRFEVQFEAPVIFVCQPTNEDGPLAKVKIHYINGTENSLAETRTRLELQDDRQAQAQLSSKERIATADNERASWLMLLNELQRMEKDSMAFEQEEYRKSPLRQRQQPDWDNHTLAAALQIKPRSWDTMPSNVKKPYATTTMCHMVEMAAMLGMHWKVFNSSVDKYRAEGNGCVMTGTKVDDLGIMFSFQIYSKRKFKENRLIPSDDIKEYCFGFVPTIWRDTNDSRRLDADENPKDLSVLQLASRQEMAETLVMIGCNTNTSNYVLSKEKKDGHLFPIAFEILGALGKTIHIENSSFRMLPNPTYHHWDEKFISPVKLLQEYRKYLATSGWQTNQISRIEGLGARVEEAMKGPPFDVGLPALDALHAALDQCDEFLLNENSKQKVLYILRQHLQLVFGMLNRDKNARLARDEDGNMVGGSLTAPAAVMSNKRDGDSDYGDLSFEDVNEAPPEERQEKLMGVYFEKILPRVLQLSALGHSWATLHQHNANPAKEGEEAHDGGAWGDAPAPGAGRMQSGKTRFLEERASDIWCTLIFRMLCWLLLHNFHKKDVQVPKSELLGCRLPVYIA